VLIPQLAFSYIGTLYPAGWLCDVTKA